MPDSTSTTSSSNPLMTAPREATVYLYPGDVEAAIDDFDARIEKALRDELTGSGAKRMSTKSSVGAAEQIAVERDEYVESVKGTATVMRLRAASTAKYERLLNECPPRKDHKGDQAVGYDQSTFRPALVRACLVEPDVTDDQFDEWVEACSAGRFAAVYAAAEDITVNEVDLPKSSAVSALTRVRGRASKRPEPTE